MSPIVPLEQERVMIRTTVDDVLAGGPLGANSMISGYIAQKKRDTMPERSTRVILRRQNRNDRIYSRQRVTQVTAFRWYERAYLSGKEDWWKSEKSLADLEVILRGEG